MIELSLTSDGLLLNVNKRHTRKRPRIFTGAALALNFPRLENNTLGELEAWLKANGKAHVVVLNALPRSRRTLNALVDLAARYNVALMLPPPRRKRGPHVAA